MSDNVIDNMRRFNPRKKIKSQIDDDFVMLAYKIIYIKPPHLKSKKKIVAIVLSDKSKSEMDHGEIHKGGITFVFIPSQWTPGYVLKNEDGLRRYINSWLLHEITHHADRDKSEAADPHEDNAAYVNHPKEVRAWMQQVSNDMVMLMRDLPRGVDRTLPLDKLLQQLLPMSLTWEAIHGVLIEENRRRILQGVVRRLQDEGLVA